MSAEQVFESIAFNVVAYIGDGDVEVQLSSQYGETPLELGADEARSLAAALLAAADASEVPL